MRLLLIDNHSLHIENLRQLCSKHHVTVIAADKLAQTDTKEYDGFILSGSYDHAVVQDDGFYMPELELIKTTDKPVLGVCMGFELICTAYGSVLHELYERAKGAAVVRPTEAGAKLFQGTEPIKVSEAHRWYVDEVPKQLVVLATSDSGVEAVKHKQKPQYGLQFHPEDFTYASDGKLVFDNILATFQTAAKQRAKQAST